MQVPQPLEHQPYDQNPLFAVPNERHQAAPSAEAAAPASKRGVAVCSSDKGNCCSGIFAPQTKAAFIQSGTYNKRCDQAFTARMLAPMLAPMWSGRWQLPLAPLLQRFPHDLQPLWSRS
mmetsp:Transcript_21695/g.41408  ORF Transcript_21695/g.41408 Transcript_21695/m.41408 type:complete len:119 (-) Transcript_21695:821-1177(-)